MIELEKGSLLSALFAQRKFISTTGWLRISSKIDNIFPSV